MTDWLLGAVSMKSRVVVEDHWDNYVAQHDESPVFVSYDRTVGDDMLMRRLGHCARVMIPIQAPNRNGGPTADESNALWDREDRLCQFLAKQQIDCRLVARLTYKGIRELVFQLSDWDSFRPVVGAWMIQNDDYQIDVSEHEGWQFVQGSVWPTGRNPSETSSPAT